MNTLVTKASHVREQVQGEPNVSLVDILTSKHLTLCERVCIRQVLDDQEINSLIMLWQQELQWRNYNIVEIVKIMSWTLECELHSPQNQGNK